jgi:putative ABC transport system permease protein
VAVVVFVLSVLLSFAAGIRESLRATGSDRNILVLAQGATSESTSLIFPDQVGRLTQIPGISRDESGQLLISQEVCLQTSTPRRAKSGSLANVAVRGVDDVAFAVHEEVRLIEGSKFQQGALQVIVGEAARERYKQLDIGGQIVLGRLANRSFDVVGVFEAKGGALESEIWAPRSVLADVFQRPQISSALIRLDNDNLAYAGIAVANGPTVGLEARRETRYYEELATKTREIVVLTSILIAIMSIGAAFAVANTMFAAVDGRRREIAMLRTIGFTRAAIITSFITESLLICGAGCLVGIGASLFVSGSRQDFLSDSTWTVLAYELTVTPDIVATALALSLAVGLIGSLMPALRASRTQIIVALRKA